MWILNHKGSQIVVFLAAALIASNPAASAQPPENAALLYYQAFLLHDEPNEAIERATRDFFVSGKMALGKISLNEAVTGNIRRNRRVIALAGRAADIATCEWGYD